MDTNSGRAQRFKTRREAAAYANVSVSFLDKARLDGSGPIFIKAGSRVLYALEDLDEWLLAHRQRSTSEFASGAR